MPHQASQLTPIQTAASQPPPDNSKENASIARRAGLVAVGTLASRVLGAVRDAAVANYFPVADTDAFYVAWTIPNTLRRVLGEGAVTAAIVPVFAEVENREGRSGARRYVAAISGVLLAALTIVSALGVLSARGWTALYAGGYQPERFEMTVSLTRWVFPYIGLVGMAALGMGILNSVGRFGVAAFAPSLLNVAVIAAPFLFVAPAVALGLPPVGALALATLVGGALQTAVQFPELAKVGLLPRPTFTLRDPAVRKTIALMGPVVLGSGIYQLNIVFSRLFASFLPEGSQSFLYYAQRMVEIPQSLFALALASAALPSLAKFKSAGDHAQAKATLRYSLRVSLFVAIPASVALVVLSEPTIAVLFHRGQFGAFHVRETAHALAWMAMSTWAVAAIHPITRMYYAYNDTRTPVYCSALNLTAFVLVSLALRERFGHVAIAAGTSIGSFVQLAGLALWLPRRVGPMNYAEVLSSAARCTAASALMGLIIYDVARLGRFADNTAWQRNLLVYSLTVMFGVVVYIAGCVLLRVRELQDVGRALNRKRAKS